MFVAHGVLLRSAAVFRLLAFSENEADWKASIYEIDYMTSSCNGARPRREQDR
ncbi:hypothetical protein KC19_VG226200 [Ceratodon purpureus]|uniref:Uncharacterized protein n=1 Tax=Ceratodon purpureus TaxID=3225 RepID=A0A8T0HSM6_CERPU|nr:hypothetical protein KC19_VG226200 [Ceratodon purpureus]